MKTLLATSAIVLMTTSAAFANPTGETVPTDTDYQAQIAQLPNRFSKY